MLHGTDSGSSCTPEYTTTSMTRTNNNHHMKILSSFTAGTSGYVFLNFCVNQQTLVGLSEISIYTLVPEIINTEPYHKILIVKIFSARSCLFPIPLPFPSIISWLQLNLISISTQVQ